MALTVPVDGRSAVGFESYPGPTPLLTIFATRPALLVTLTLPEHLDAGCCYGFTPSVSMTARTSRTRALMPLCTWADDRATGSRVIPRISHAQRLTAAFRGIWLHIPGAHPRRR